MRLALGYHVVHQNDHCANREARNAAQGCINHPRQCPFMQAEKRRWVKAKAVDDNLPANP